MAKSCVNQQPTIRVRVHTPEIPPVHRHLDSTFTVKADSDFAAWAQVCSKLLAALGITHPALVLGFLLDLCNSLPVEMRQYLIAGIGLGLGCEVAEEEDGAVSIKQVQRYTPLITEEERPSGLVLPPQNDKLIIP